MSKDDRDQPCNEPDCCVCNRVDSEVITDTHVHIATYVGDYVVTTIVAPELRDPTVASLQMLGITRIPTLVVMVGYVGNDSLEGSKESVPDSEFVRFLTRHSNVTDPRGPHDMLVEEVKAGTVDLSEPLSIKDLEEQSRQYFRDALTRLDGLGESTFDL